MKQLLIIIVAVTTASCGSTTKKYEPAKADTFQVVGMFRDAKGKVYIDGIYCVARDSFDYVDIGDNIQKRQWHRDTMFFIPNLVPQKIVTSDSTTKDTSFLQWVYARPEQILLMSGSYKNRGRIDGAFKK